MVQLPVRQWLSLWLHALAIRGAPKRPLIAFLKLTRRCNLSCRRCPWHDVPMAEISTRQWVQVLATLRREGVLLVVFEGGEPTMRPDLQQIIDTAALKGFRTAIITNGTNPVPRARLDCIWVSIDGPPGLHDELRGEGVSEAIKANAAEARAWCRAFAVITITSADHRRVSETIYAWRAYFEAFFLSFGVPYVEGQQSECLDGNAIDSVLRSVREKHKLLPLLNTPEGLARPGELQRCPWRLLTVIDADGRRKRGCFPEIVLGRQACEGCGLTLYSELNAFVRPSMSAARSLAQVLGKVL